MVLWNWQQLDWTHFSWETKLLAKAEEQFLLKGGIILGMLNHLNPDETSNYISEALTEEAIQTSAIEGETLNRESVRSSIRRQLGLSTDNIRVAAAEQGIAQMTVNLYRTFHQQLTHETMFTWHEAIMQAYKNKKNNYIENIGSYRTHKEAMQIVSGSGAKVFYEAPPSSQVTDEMDNFVDWFNRTAPDGSEPLPAITRAGIAHLYFVCIHPFEDGNGRLSRALAEKALAQALGQPTFTVLAKTILSQRKYYYDALDKANKTNNVTDWLLWFAKTVAESQQNTLTLVEFLIKKTHFLDHFSEHLNERQKKALLKMLEEEPTSFIGGMSADKYQRITKSSPATTTRDLTDMVNKKVLQRTGQRKGTRYFLDLDDLPPE